MRRFLFPPLFLGGLLGLQAATAPAPSVLPAVDVVATPIVGETTLNPFGFETTTVGRDQIDALNAADIAAALRRTPGVSIARYNAVGSFGGGEGGAVFLRGLGSSRPGGEIKTTIDGVPMGNGVFNHPLLDLLPIDLAAGIEVSRRAEPLMQGNMFAGVNLTTPRFAQSGGFAQAAVSGGSFGAFSEKFEAGGRFGNTEVFAGESFRRADGHRPDADGRLANALLRLGWHVQPQLEFSYLVHRSDNRATDPGPERGAGLPPTRGDVYTTESWLHLATARWTRANGGGSLKAYLNQGDGNWLRRTTSANPDSLNHYRQTGLRWRESERPWDGGEIIGGVDVDWTRGKSISVPPGTAPMLSFGPEQFRLASGYVGLRHTAELGGDVQVTPSVGVRYYTHEQFGHAWAPQVGVVARTGPVQAHASFSRALNFPGLDVAAFSTVVIPPLGQSWRTLRPERLAQSEAGIRYDLSTTASVDLTVFRNEGRDRYVFVPPPPPPFRFLNVEKFRTQGGELTATARPAKVVTLFGGVSRLSSTPSDLPYAPHWSLVGGLTWRITSALMLNADTSYVSSQRAGAQARAAAVINTERVPAFAVLNARLAYAFAWQSARPERKGEVFLAVDNALDRDYRYRPGYPMPGVGFTFGVTGRF